MGKKKHRLRRAREQRAVTKRTTRTADNGILDAVEDIGMRVGWMSFATQDANVPIYATVECWFPGTKELARIPERLALSWEGLRYKVYLPDRADAPLAYQDDPVPKEHHETFQRLFKHWGYWFLRLHGDAKTWDFQVFENEQVFALQHSIEEALRAFATPLPREHVIDVLAESLAGRRPADVARAAAIDTVDKFEALVGPLPVVPPDRPTSVRAYTCRHDGSLGVFVTLDVDDLEGRLQQIIGGPMLNLLWEGVAPGVDLAQFFSKDGRKDKPEVWLRQKQGVHGQSVGSRVKLFGKRIPMEKFVPEAAESVQDSDLPTIRKIGYEVGVYDGGVRRAAELPNVRLCAICNATATRWHNLDTVYCDAHREASLKALTKGRYLKTLARNAQNPPPCGRCGRIGPRHQFLVEFDGAGTRDVCLPCADEVDASEMAHVVAKLGPGATPQDFARALEEHRRGIPDAVPSAVEVMGAGDTAFVGAVPKGQAEVLMREVIKLLPKYFSDRILPPKDPSGKCQVSGCTETPPGMHVYCATHAEERCRSMPKAKYVRHMPIVEQSKQAPPCYRCGKFGGRYRYFVRIDGKERDVCMDCADEMQASEMFTESANAPTATLPPVQHAAPPSSTTEVDKATHEAIIAAYIQLCQVVRLAAMGGDAGAAKVWPRLRDAVIFELPAAAYMTLFAEFSRYIVRCARVNPDLNESERTPAQQKRIKDVIDSGRLAPFPEKLPFRECFFAYGRGINEASPWSGEGFPTQPDSSLLLGHLVTSNGLVVSFREAAMTDGGKRKIAAVFNIEREGGEWDSGMTLSPWIVNALVAYVNEHKTLIEAGKQSGSYERFVKRTFRNLNPDGKPPIPPPFYVVYLKDVFIKERARTQAALIKRHIDWQHRWKVRGHECLRFQRGLLPLDPELEQELRARKYRIFTVEQPDSETFMALAQRGVPPKSSTEWMAVLRYWQQECIHGPEDKPLIESVRRSTKKWAVVPGPDGGSSPPNERN